MVKSNKNQIVLNTCASCKPWFIVCEDDCPIGCKRHLSTQKHRINKPLKSITNE